MPKDDGQQILQPHWLFNTSASSTDANYLACAVKPTLPIETTGPHRKYVSVLKPCAPLEPLVKAALRTGKCWLSATHLQQVCQANGVPAPEGTGKENKRTGVRNIVKKDRATALVKYLFPSENQEVKDTIVRGILGAANGLVSKDSFAEVLKELDELDEENRAAFGGLEKMAKQVKKQKEHDDVREEVMKEGRGAFAQITQRNA